MFSFFSFSVTQQSPNATAQPNRTVTPGKVMIASGSPQAPVQKKLSTGPVAGTGSGTSPVFRGAPPPIPPNKPILPANALKERSKEIQQATVRAKMMTAKSITPLPSSTPVPVQGEPVVNDKPSSSALTNSVVVNGTIKRQDKSLMLSNSSNSTEQVPGENNLNNVSLKNASNGCNDTTSDTSDDSVNHQNEEFTNVEMISQEIADFQQLLGSMVEKSIIG